MKFARIPFATIVDQIHGLIDKLSSRSRMPSPPENEREFNELALDLFACQFDANQAFRRLCEARNVDPHRVEHWSEIPFVPTVSFREFDFTVLPTKNRPVVFRSSGTTQQNRSRHFHNEASLQLYEASVCGWFHKRVIGKSSGRKRNGAQGNGINLLILTPSGSAAPHSSLAHMFETVRHEFGGTHSLFAGAVDGRGRWTLDLESIESWLTRHAVLREPVLVMGTAFNFVHLLDWLIARDLHFQLPEGSLLLETGGYKGLSRELPKEELHELIGERLGLTENRIVCEYGMCELSSQAYDRQPGRDSDRVFHFPPWARTRVVSPETGREVADGESGLIQVLDLANAWSVLAVQTEDVGVRRGGGFELLGRAGEADQKGCSLMSD